MSKNDADDRGDKEAGHDDGPVIINELYRPRRTKPIMELPGLIGRALSLVWMAGRRNTQVLMVITVMQAVLTAAQLLLIRRLLSGLSDVSNGANVRTIVPELIAFVAVMTAQGMTGLVDGQVRQVLGEEVNRHATSQVARAAAAADLLDFERPGFHDRLRRSLMNASGRPLQTAFAVATIASTGLTSLAVIATLAVVQPLLLVLLLGGFIPIWLVTRRLTRMGVDWTMAQSHDERRRQYFLMLLTAKEMAKELRAYQLADEIDRRHGELWDWRLTQLRKLTRERIRIGLVGRFLNGLLLGAMVAALAWMVSSGRASVSEAGAAAAGVLVLGSRLNALVGSVGQLYECSLFLEDIEQFMDERVTHAAALPTGTLPLPLMELRADNVHFAYPAGHGEALAGINLTVRPGEMVALVGVNGSGKTTLAKVLAGLYPPTSGTTSWNGVDASSVDPEQWRAQVAVVFQDYARYLLTMTENVGFGRVEVADDVERAQRAAVSAGLDDLVASLPDGWDTLLGPEFIGGSDLSGGQWQKIALARAFFRDAPVVILDEPSSALDPEAEAALFDRVKELCAGRAVVVISHRFSTVTRADRIYVLEAGRIIEHGTHGELLGAGGEYSRLFRLQASQYGIMDE